MGILLAFAPFIAFAVIDHLFGDLAGLLVGAAVSAVMLLRDWVSPGRTPKLLEVGTTLLFGGLALYALLSDPAWSVAAVRLRVDGGLLLIVLVSIAVRRPFTLQYARERVAAELWGSATFVRTNYMITAAWALAFAIMVVADLVLVYEPALSRAAIVATVLALVGAVKFTAWYPERGRTAAGASFAPGRIR